MTDKETLSLRHLGVFFDQSMSLDGHSRQLIRNCFIIWEILRTLVCVSGFQRHA